MTRPSPRDEARRSMMAEIEAGRAVTDIAFDRIYPERIRKVSSRFWTPVSIARIASRLLAEHGARHVLDIGAGCGKFCIVAALSTNLELTGIEHRPGLVAAAREAIDTFAIPRVKMVHGELTDVDLDAFDGFYLYNPFEEAGFEPAAWADRTLSLSLESAQRDVEIVEKHLQKARPGTSVITFHGFGGAMPEGWIYLAEATRGVAFLRLWVKG